MVGVKLGGDNNGCYWLLDMVRGRANLGGFDKLLLDTVRRGVRCHRVPPKPFAPPGSMEWLAAKKKSSLTQAALGPKCVCTTSSGRSARITGQQSLRAPGSEFESVSLPPANLSCRGDPSASIENPRAAANPMRPV